MVANFIILGFVIFMAYWWGQQGLFGAILHCAATIIAGALALAVWEPLTTGILIKMIPQQAWGVGLLLPFVVFLLLFRISYDKFIKFNVYLNSMANMIGGGAFGFFSAVISVGICLMGVSFLSLGVSLAGYQPYLLGPDGHIASNPSGSLWIPADTMTASFFTKLSGGAFANRTPLVRYLPHLRRQAGGFRIHVDGNAMLVAIPGSVTVDKVYTAKTPMRTLDDSLLKVVGNEIKQADHRVIVVDTVWHFTYPTYNATDNTLRVSPTQVQLIARPKNQPHGPHHLYAPIGASILKDNQRQFIPLLDAQTLVSGTDPQQDQIGWVFVVELDERPVDLIVRRLRLHLPSFKNKKKVKRSRNKTGVVIGQLAPAFWKQYGFNQEVSPDEAEASASSTTPGNGAVGGRQGMKTGSVAATIEVSDKLPQEFTRNRVQGTIDLTDKNMIKTANLTSRMFNGRVSPANLVKGFYLPKHKAMVRVRINRDAAQSLLGKTRMAAAMVQTIYLTDDHGDKWSPTAYVWIHDRIIKIVKDPGIPLQYAKQLPIADLRKDHQLYLYFAVDRNRKIVAYNVGQTKQEVSLTIPQ